MCDLCEFTCNEIGALEKHTHDVHKSKETEVDLACDLCVYMTLSEADMQSHIEANHNKNKEVGQQVNEVEIDEQNHIEANNQTNEEDEHEADPQAKKMEVDQETVVC